jgi:hypothetical protein
LSTKLKKRHAGALLAGLTLSIAILAALVPGWAEAQEVDTAAVSIETAQNPNNDQSRAAYDEVTTATAATVTTSSQSAYEPVAALVVEPGDSLWAIAQERLGSEATPQQVAEETGRIYELNRGRIGEDPNLIFPDQELLLTQGHKPVADVSPTTGVATEPAAQEPTAEQQTMMVAQETSEPAGDESSAESSSKANTIEPFYAEPRYTDRLVPDVLTLLISLGVFLAALAIATLAVVKLRRRRRQLGGGYGPSHAPSIRDDQPRYPGREKKESAVDVPGPTAEVRETSDKE